VCQKGYKFVGTETHYLVFYLRGYIIRLSLVLVKFTSVLLYLISFHIICIIKQCIDLKLDHENRDTQN